MILDLKLWFFLKLVGGAFVVLPALLKRRGFVRLQLQVPGSCVAHEAAMGFA